MESGRNNINPESNEDIELQLLPNEIDQQHIPSDITTAPPSKAERVRRAALSSLVEAMIAIGYSSTTTAFLASNTSWIRHPFVISTFFMLINFLLRIPSSADEWTRKQLRVIRGAIFALMDNRTRYIVLHEGGHALTALSLFQFKLDYPYIEITPNYNMSSGARTVYNSNTLSSLAKQLGLSLSSSKLAVTAAGVGISTLWNGTSLIAAQSMSDEHPEIKSHLRMTALISIFSDLLYALSAYIKCDKGNDFCALKENDISPLFIILFITTSMLALQLFLTCSTRYVCNSTNIVESENKMFRP